MSRRKSISINQSRPRHRKDEDRKAKRSGKVVENKAIIEAEGVNEDDGDVEAYTTLIDDEPLEDEMVDLTQESQKVVTMFDRFRADYIELSSTLRQEIKAHRLMLNKCCQFKNELVSEALAIEALNRVHDKHVKDMSFYRNECEHAWMESKSSQQREQSAMNIIDDMKVEINSLVSQVGPFVNMASPRRCTSASSSKDNRRLSMQSTQIGFQLRPKGTKQTMGKYQSELLSFDEWKKANRLWTPSEFSSKPQVPTLQSLQEMEEQRCMERASSVPVLRHTPMERATTAMASRKQHLRPSSVCSPSKNSQLPGLR